MKCRISKDYKVNRGEQKSKRNLPLSPNQIKGLLRYHGLEIKDVAKLLGYKNATPVSLALHRRRRTPKSDMILARLGELANGETIPGENN